jgi:hypothetical protein
MRRVPADRVLDADGFDVFVDEPGEGDLARDGDTE